MFRFSIRDVLWLTVVVGLALCLGCSGGSNKLTADNYRAIQAGMSMDKVKSLLGEPDFVNRYRGDTQWYYERGKVSAGVTFGRNGGVVHKNETGLGVGDKEY